MILPCLEMRGPQPAWSEWGPHSPFLDLGSGGGLEFLGWHFSFPRDCCGLFPELGAWQCAAESRACLHSRWAPALPMTDIPKQWRGQCLRFSLESEVPLLENSGFPHPRGSEEKPFIFIFSLCSSRELLQFTNWHSLWFFEAGSARGLGWRKGA